MRPFLLIAIAILSIGTFARAPAAEITVSAAVSLKEALTEAAAAYEKETGLRVNLNFGASGQLLAQIRDGAPVDGFVAASTAQMKEAVRLNLVDAYGQYTLAGNRLVLIVPEDSTLELRDFRALADRKVKRVAIGQPRTVPAGEYAVQALRHARVLDAVADRLVFGATVRQVLDYVERGAVDAGIVYATDAAEAGERVRAVATAPPGAHEPIWYPYAAVRKRPNERAAAAFGRWLQTENGQQFFADRGFVSPVTPPRPTPATRPAAGGATSAPVTN